MKRTTVPKEKKVMLYSGGLDSRLQLPFIDPDVLLYVNLETQYTDHEIRQLPKQLPSKYKNRLVITPSIDLEPFERSDFYLPFRNAMLCLLAAQYGQHIYFGFNASDNAPDKDADFMIQMRILLQTMGKPKYVPDTWEGNSVTVSAPYGNFTKTEMVHNFLLAKKGRPLDVKAIRTCYSHNSVKGCGECAPCAHKAVALLNNDISLKGVFDVDITRDTLKYWMDKHVEWRPGNRVLKDFADASSRI